MIKLPITKTEKILTQLISNNWTHPGLDKFMIIVSNPYQWIIPTLAFTMILIYLDWQSALVAILTGGVGAGIADSINARYIKQHTDRIRPGKQFSEIRSLGTMNKGLKSFPSNHASNTMAIALAFSLSFPKAGFFLVPLSILVGYSRIYCGAHFPLDVLAGWIHGSIWVIVISVILNSI